jgi:hypothetical protein
MILDWLQAFVFTQLVEVPIYRRALGGRTAVAFGASALTHPVVWFVFPRLGLGGYAASLVGAELFAVLVEAAWLRAFGLRRALAWSAAANAASLALGLASRALFSRT